MIVKLATTITAIALISGVSLTAPNAALANAQEDDPNSSQVDNGNDVNSIQSGETNYKLKDFGSISKNLASTGATTPSATTDFVLPLKKNSYWLSSYAGNRCPVIPGAGLYHGAIDLAASDGTPIYAVSDGVVEKIIEPMGINLAGSIVVNHGVYKGKKLVLYYDHPWNPSKYFKVGNKVKKDQKIAEVGASGPATGPHLHLAATWGNDWIDPLAFFRANGLDIKTSALWAAEEPDPLTHCSVYAHGAQSVLSNSNYDSKVLKVIPNGTFMTMKAGPSNGIYSEVTLKDGTKGFVMNTSVATSERLSDPLLLNVGYAEAGFTYQLTKYASQYFRDFPSNANGIGGVTGLVTEHDKIVSTGRIINGTAWEEFKFNGMTGWINNYDAYIKDITPTGVTNSNDSNKDYTVNSTKLYPIPTLSNKVYSNKSVIIAANSAVVKTTGLVYKTWSQVTFKSLKYWTPTAGLKLHVVTKPTVKPEVKPPSITKGDVVAKDSSGKLWNYGNIIKNTNKARILIGSVGWSDMKDVIVTDFDANGVLDLIANNKKDGKLYFYSGKKNGGFEARKALGSGGWGSLEIHAVKMKKTDKYPSIVSRTSGGHLNLYTNSNGKSLGGVKLIGSGWKDFAAINFVYYDNNGNIDVLAQSKSGIVTLYRTNGSAFVNETRKKVTTGWSGNKTSSGAHQTGTNMTGILSIKSGKLLYIPLTGRGSLSTMKTLASSGWGSYSIARQSI